MKTFHEKSIQFHTNDGIGLRLANAAARKGLSRASTALNPITLPQPLSGKVREDTITLGTHALLSHVRQLMHGHPLDIFVDNPTRIRIRVCGALDYVIARAQQRIWSEPAPLTRAERSAKERPPWHHPFSDPLDIIDVLNPLSRPAWLVWLRIRTP